MYSQFKLLGVGLSYVPLFILFDPSSRKKPDAYEKNEFMGRAGMHAQSCS